MERRAKARVGIGVVLSLLVAAGSVSFAPEGTSPQPVRRPHRRAGERGRFESVSPAVGRPESAHRVAPAALRVGEPEATSAFEDDPGRSVVAMMTLDPAVLREIARHSQDPVEVQAAVWALANHAGLDDESADTMSDLLQREWDREDRPDLLKTLLWAFTLRPDRLPVPLLSRMAGENGSPAVRRGAARALAVSADPLSLRPLQDAARNDPDPWNRAEAITWLALRADPGIGVPQVREALGRESDGLVRAHWVSVLGLSSDPGAPDLLERISRSSAEPPEARAMAAETLAGRSPARAARIAADRSLPDDVRARLQPSYLAAAAGTR